MSFDFGRRPISPSLEELNNTIYATNLTSATGATGMTQGGLNSGAASMLDEKEINQIFDETGVNDAKSSTVANKRFKHPHPGFTLPSLKAIRERNTKVLNLTDPKTWDTYPEEKAVSETDYNRLKEERRSKHAAFRFMQKNIAAHLHMNEDTVSNIVTEAFTKLLLTPHTRQMFINELDREFYDPVLKDNSPWLLSTARANLVAADFRFNLVPDRRHKGAYQPADEKTQHFIETVENLLLFADENHSLSKMKILTRLPNELNLPTLHHNSAKLFEKAMIKENAREQNPQFILDYLLKAKRGDKLVDPYNFSFDDSTVSTVPNTEHLRVLWENNPNFEQEIQALKDEATNARNLRANNIYSAQDYRKVLDNLYQDIFRFTPAHPKIKEEDEMDPLRPMVLENNEDKERRMLIAKGILDEKRRQGYQAKSNVTMTNMQLFQNLAVQIKHDIKNLPDSQYKQKVVIGNQLKNIKRDLKDGVIDITRAYQLLNGLNSVKQVILSNPDRYIYPKESTVMDNEAPRGKDPEKVDDKFYANVRTSTRLFGYPGISFEEAKYSGLEPVVKNIYNFSIKERRKMNDALTRLGNDWYNQVGPAHIADDDARRFAERFHNVMYRDGNPVFQHLNMEDEERYGFMNKNSIPSYDEVKEEQLPILKRNLAEAKAFTIALRNYLIENDGVPKYKKSKLHAIRARLLPSFQDRKPIPINVVKTDNTPIEPTFKIPNQKQTTEELLSKTLEYQDRMKNQNRQKEALFNQPAYSMKPTKEWPESLKLEHYDKSIEYQVKTQEDLVRMISEVSKKGGQLYIIDLATGRLFPINWTDAFVGAIYVWKAKANQGGSFASNAARIAILHSAESKSPFTHLRDGNDKTYQMYHNLLIKKHNYDYRNQLRDEHGASLWGWVKKKVVDTAKNAVTQGAKNLVKDVKTSANTNWNYLKRAEQRNYNNIYQSGSNLIRHPSWSSFSNAALGIGKGVGNMVLQPIVSGTRLTADTLDSTNNIPGLNFIKYGAEYALPPLAIVNGLAHAVKSSGIASTDRTNYLKTLTDLGDALIGSGALKGTQQIGAQLLNGGLEVIGKNI